jgi:DNA polymerase V
VLVLSANDGCVISRSKEVKELGIPMGVPHFEIREKIAKEGITIFSSNFTLYRDISSRVMSTVKRVVLDAEVYSIDEAFFTVAPKDAASTAQEVKQKVEQWVGIPVSIGIGETKTIAKHMGAYAKTHGGIAIISPDAENALRAASLQEIWGVGRKTYEKLERGGVRTVADVLEQGAVRMRAHLGIHGEQLFYELSGIAPVGERQREHHQSIMSSASFGKRIQHISEVEDALSYHIAQVAEKARQSGCVAHTLSFTIRYEDADGAVRHVSDQVTLAPATADTRKLIKAVLQAALPFFKSSFRYKKVGVVLSQLVPIGVATGSLFDAPQATDEAGSLMKVFDAINRKHGRGSVRIGTEQKTHTWKGKSVFVSQAYTTSWTSLPHAEIK